MQSILPKADVFVIKNFLTQRESILLFSRIEKSTNWSKITYGSHNPSRIKEGETNTCYSTHQMQSNFITVKLSEIQEKIIKKYNLKLDRCDLNYYPTSDIGLVYHQDDDCIADQPMAILSLGATRTIWFRDLESKEEYPFILTSGDLLIMSKNSQFKYEHGLKSEPDRIGARISACFRPILCHLDH